MRQATRASLRRGYQAAGQLHPIPDLALRSRNFVQKGPQLLKHLAFSGGEPALNR